MDPIKNLIAGTDPLHSDPFGVPDGETELRRMLSEPAAFSDNVATGVASLDDARRRRRAKVAALLTIAVAAVAAGVLVAGNLGALTSAPEPASTVAAATETATATPTTSATATPTPTPTPTATPSAAPAAWTKFTDATGQATFEHPVGWTVTEEPQTIQGAGYNVIGVNNSAGKKVATLDLIYDRAAGYTCPVPKPYNTLDAVALDIPQKAAKLKELPRGPSEFVFRVIQSDKVYGSMALNDAELAPGTTTCVLYNSILGPEDTPTVSFGDTWSLQQDGKDAPLTFGSVAEAEAYMQTQEYRDMKRMLISLELRPVKKPVEWKSYTSGNGLGSFEYPDNWTIAGREDGRYSDVVNDQGRTLLTLGFNQTRNMPNLISPCTPFTVLDSAPMSFPSNRQGERAIPPQFIFRVWDVTYFARDSAPFVANLGIADESWGVDGTTCDPQNVVSGLPSGEYFFAQNYNSGAATDLKFYSMDEARAYMESEEFKTLKRIVMSLKIHG
ncbi:hypothetical protein [Arthrobacter sp. ISL-72]|uniref:hypothetical protein n=1 Tax=Arthrobacter sp. ISL-72 TaxID=2819114 RepID=UPI001BE9BEC6|nr:hypothetical protein [Arthrobacter sp. ISL-72]MBT2597771.1 hypothetical protein [Arthrobacter sp. ISL-72]